MSRPLRIFVFTSSLSAFGSYLSMIALNLFAFAATGSALVTGLFMALRLVSALAMGPFAGQLATHWSRRATIVIGNGVQATGLLLLALLAGTSADLVPVLLGLSVVNGAAATAANVAQRASLPVMAGASATLRANGVMVTARSFAMILGFASAGVIVATAGYRAAFLIDAATFVIAAAVVAWLPLGLRDRSEHRGEAAGDPPSPASRRLAWLRASGIPRIVLVLVAIRALDAFGSGSHNLALPVYFGESHPDDAARFYGGFWSVWAVGGVLAYSLMRAIQGRWSGDDTGTRIFVIGTCAMSSFFVLAFCGLPFLVLLVVASLAGVADGITEISYTTRIQAMPDDDRGRAFALSTMAEDGGFGLGLLITSPLLPLLGVLPTVALLHAFPIVVGLIYLARRRSPVVVASRC